MARKNYSEEFRRQAVDLYETTPGATVRGIAEDLGIVRGTLRHWLQAYGTGKKTAADGTLTSSPLQSKAAPPGPSEDESLEQRVARLEAENAALRRSEEHTSELQSRGHLVCRLLLEKKKETRRQRMATEKR